MGSTPRPCRNSPPPWEHARSAPHGNCTHGGKAPIGGVIMASTAGAVPAGICSPQTPLRGAA
eukprot:6953630-Alexandrium_andersonii.AAC.1